MKSAFRIFSRAVQVLAMITLWWLGYALDMDDDQVGLVGKLIAFSQVNASTLVLSSGVALLAAQGIAVLLKSPSKEQIILDNLISRALNKFRNVVYCSVPGTEPRDNNRVSVFQYYSCKWRIIPWRSPVWPWGFWRSPFSGWLAVTHRSGHQTQLKTATFLAPDDAPKAEGVAGKAWRSESVTRVKDLPNINNIEYVGVFKRFYIWALLRRFSPESDLIKRFDKAEATVSIYAKHTHTHPKQVWKRIKAKKQSPISILAIPLETADNDRWGVLVMDSSNGFECLDSVDAKFRRAFSELQKTLARCGVRKRS